MIVIVSYIALLLIFLCLLSNAVFTIYIDHIERKYEREEEQAK